MRITKALHRAARKSLDGHVRFVVKIDRGCHVCELRDLCNLRCGRIEAAYSAGRYVPAS
ncbi:hypothetical protein [Trinickia mobilis]|uniref:hypothetical protein n=1 Tax=Trinickia mobilis TaxID=2816356 RepID=UPI001A8FA6FD|nr:hypothetical protein [Trinickia mobilis]